VSDTTRHYAGREQSYVKHTFLRTYLKAFAIKVFQGRDETINFIDAFAGPWSVNDKDNYSDSSFALAISVLEEIRNFLIERGHENCRVRYCFCERSQKSFEKLKDFATKRSDIEIHVFQGDFADNLDLISETCIDGFTFTFIDPTGWKINSTKLFSFLAQQNGEFLLNFMSDHINRHAGWDGVAVSYGNFLADPEWKVKFDSLSSDKGRNWSNEEKVLSLLRRVAKKSGAAKFMPDMPIQHSVQNRVKMRLVLGTHFWPAVVLFRDIQEKVEREEIVIRNRLREDRERRKSLFDEQAIIDLQKAETGVGGRIARDRTRKLILSFLKVRPRDFSAIEGYVLERVPMRQTHLKDLLLILRDEEKVNFTLPRKSRKPKSGVRIELTGK